jgi:hypothetical protein
MFIQTGLLCLMWSLADEPTVVHSCLLTSVVSAFCLHLATIAEIAQNDFSYYHTSVAIHLILLTIVPFLCALQYPGWKGLGLGEKISCILNALTLVTEFVYLAHTTSGTAQLAQSCVDFTEDFFNFNTNFTGFVLFVTLFLLLKTVVDTKRPSVIIAFTLFGAMWVTYMSAALQINVVAQYQQFTDGSEAKFGFGQIFCMAAITKPVYDLYQYGRDDSQRADQIIPRWRQWKSQCISLIKPFNCFRSRFVL